MAAVDVHNIGTAMAGYPATVERSTATVLFTDLVGSTEFRSRLGDEAAEDVRRRHDRILAEAVEAHRGHVVKTLGDGLMATFAGAGDAVAAAIGIQQSIDRHNRAADSPISLNVRIGVSAGDVTFEDGDCYGRPVVEASRICAAARGGQILTSEVVRWLAGAGGAHRLVPVGPLHLKGLADPVPACEVVWEPAPASTIPLPPLLTGPGRIFVGRGVDLSHLRDWWEKASGGQGRIVLISGEPGVGKTRLAAELGRAAQAEGATVLAGRCDEDLAVPYQPFVEALRHFVDHVPTADLIGRLGRHPGELVRLMPDLGERVPGLPPPVRSDPDTERYHLFEAVASWLSGPEAGPVLLVLDDLQWAAQPTMLLLRRVAEASKATKLLVVATYRDTELGRSHPLTDLIADLRRGPVVERISLTGLGASEVASFMEQAAGHDLDEQDQAFARDVYEETEGNPLFVAEVLRHLAETGLMYLEDGRWVFRGLQPFHLDLPEGVRDVIGRRLARLSDDARLSLVHAAVLGRDFEFDVLARMGDVSDDLLLNAVEEADSARVVAEVNGLASATYTFTHALVRETLLADLSAARKERLHLRAAQAIEDVYSGRTEAQAAALAGHYRLAGRSAPPGKVIEYALLAGDGAARCLAWEDAAVHWRRALKLMEEHGGDPRHRAALLSRLTDLMFVTGLDRAQGIHYATKALGVYVELGEKESVARMHSRLGRDMASFHSVMDVPRALEHLRAAEQVLGRGGNSIALAHVHVSLASAEAWAMHAEAGLRSAQQAVEIAGRLGDIGLAALAHAILGGTLGLHGRIAEGSTILAEGWDAADRVDHRFAGFSSVRQHTILALQLLDPGAAEHWVKRELDRPRLAQAPELRSILHGQLAWAQALSGRLAEARTTLTHAPELPVGAWLAPPLQFWEGNWSEAGRRFAEERQRARVTGNRWEECALGRWLAEAHRLAGDHVSARRFLEEALALEPDALLEAGLRIDAAFHCAEDGDDAAVRAHLQRARHLMAATEDWRGLTGRLALAEALAASLDQPAGADASFSQAVEIFRRYRLPWEEAEAFRLWGRALMQAGEPQAANERLLTAAELYVRCGAGHPWLDRLEPGASPAREIVLSRPNSRTRGTPIGSASGRSPHVERGAR
jgi:class 3 adenylate cyclase/tetratricopeptide (TPR) repeat protein